MNSLAQGWAQTITIAAAIMGALIYQTHYTDTRLADMKDWLRSEFRHLEERLERLEHPLIKQ